MEQKTTVRPHIVLFTLLLLNAPVVRVTADEAVGTSRIWKGHHADY